RDFGCGRGGEAGTSPQRAVTAELTQVTDKRPAARRLFAEKAGWLRCSSVRDRCGYPHSSRLASQPFPRKQEPTEFSDRLLKRPDPIAQSGRSQNLLFPRLQVLHPAAGRAAVG